MAIVEDLRDWIGKDVVDTADQKVGKLKDVYFDVESDEPVFVVVDPGRKDDDMLAPAWNASVTPDRVRLSYTNEALGGSPTLAHLADLNTDTERELFNFYKVEYVPSRTGSGRRLMRR